MLVVLEIAVPIAESAVRVRKLANRSPIQESDRLDTLMRRPAVRARVAVHRSTHPTRNSRHGVDAGQTVVDRKIDQRLQVSARFDCNDSPFERDVFGGVPDDYSRVPVICNHEITAATNHDEWRCLCAETRQCAKKGAFGGRIDKQGSGTAEAEPRIPAQRSVRLQAQPFNSGETRCYSGDIEH